MVEKSMDYNICQYNILQNINGFSIYTKWLQKNVKHDRLAVFVGSLHVGLQNV